MLYRYYKTLESFRRLWQRLVELMPWTTATTRATGFTMTAAIWNAEHVDNVNFLKRVGHTPFTSPVPISATTSATANLIVSAGAITFEAVPHRIVFSAPVLRRVGVATGAPVFTLGLYDNGAANGVARIGEFLAASTNLLRADLDVEYFFTPTAASHTYEIRGYVNTADTWSVDAGAGGNDVLAPGYISIYRVPT